MSVVIEPTKKFTWKAALENKRYKSRLITGGILFIAVMCSFTPFFQYIQKREGVVMHDYLLERITPVNVSMPLMLCIWAAALIIIIRVINCPGIFLKFLWFFVLLSLFRFTTILLVALNPPAGIITIVDPLSTMFYGKTFITKDLFFSGHTATVFGIFLCLQKKADRLFVLCLSVAVGILVLVQHMHYTVDVLCAPVFAYAAYWLALKITGLKNIPGSPRLVNKTVNDTA